jgi:hypothetical protein
MVSLPHAETDITVHVIALVIVGKVLSVLRWHALPHVFAARVLRRRYRLQVSGLMRGHPPGYRTERIRPIGQGCRWIPRSMSSLIFWCRATTSPITTQRKQNVRKAIVPIIPYASVISENGPIMRFERHCPRRPTIFPKRDTVKEIPGRVNAVRAPGQLHK